MTPQLIHRIQFGCSTWQKAKLKTQARCKVLTIFGRMRAGTIFQHHNVPAAPMAANDLQKVLMRDVVPRFGNQQLDIARANIDRAVHDAACMTARDRNAFLFAASRITTVERRRFQHDDFIQHQDDGAFLIK